MQTPIETLKFPKGITVQIFQDEEPQNPRDNDNLGTMALFHRRMILGDVNHGLTVEQAPAMESRKDVLCLPVYAYEHGGITISTSDGHYPFNDRWDAGRAGIIFITKEKIREEYGWKVITKKRREEIMGRLQAEVEEYDLYLRGECYGYKAFENGEAADDSCWGFLGMKYLKEELNANYGKDKTDALADTSAPAVCSC
jgi:hypothetical protein